MAYKMKGSPMQRNFGSALYKKESKIDMNDPKVKANYEKYKDNPEYRKAMNKKAGGEFSYDAKTNTGTVKKDVKK
tara:strand:+ start:1783 stop:2007 length:225 start_codon:yes stop_codon:yes gene_type:complete